jgi:hypothetical protein
MIISGNTLHKLDKIRSYKKNEPYIVGYKGVTKVVKDNEGNVIEVTYVMDGIEYVSDLSLIVQSGNPEFLTNPLTQTKIDIPTTFFNKDIISASEFFENDKFLFKEEIKMNQISEPKIDERIFIERQRQSVMELHSRLGEITSIGMLEDYKNGFYNVTKLF